MSTSILRYMQISEYDVTHQIKNNNRRIII